MSERSDAVRAWADKYKPGEYYDALKALLDEHERMEEVLAVARDFLATNGSFLASDGYPSYKVGDAEPLRKALAQFDGYVTKPADQPRVYEDPTDVYTEMAEAQNRKDPLDGIGLNGGAPRW